MSYIEIPMADYRRRLLSLHSAGDQPVGRSGTGLDGRRFPAEGRPE